jgi:hypothetical protein
MKFPAATNAAFFFDVGRAKNCSSTPFAVIARLPLDTAPWDSSTDRCAALANYESDAVRLRSAASGWVVIPAAGH